MKRQYTASVGFCTVVSLIVAMPVVDFHGQVATLAASCSSSTENSKTAVDEALESGTTHLRRQGYTVIPHSVVVGLTSNARVQWYGMARRHLDGQLVHVSVDLEYQEGRWVVTRLGTLCCGEH